MQNGLWVFIGGGLGSLLRYVISVWMPSQNQHFPWATFMVNILGSCFIGYLMATLAQHSNQSAAYRALPFLLVTGFCGGFTTFSTFSFENIRLLQNHQYLLSAVYILASLLLCLGATALGYFVGK
ncbi:MAG: fluoride efflux transporter CrcB [Bacteroidetes bacterium]|nr:fluoride efflux transporter CrcB [Bacteroidota bacterium]